MFALQDLVPNTSMRPQTIAPHPVDSIQVGVERRGDGVGPFLVNVFLVGALQQGRVELEKRLEMTTMKNVYGSFLPL